MRVTANFSSPNLALLGIMTSTAQMIEVDEEIQTTNLETIQLVSIGFVFFQINIFWK